MDMIEALIGLIWLLVFVSSVVRGISGGLRRAEQEATRRARRRADGSGPVAFPAEWPAGSGRPLGPVVILDGGDEEEGAQRSDEGTEFEVEPAPEHEMAPSPAEWTEGEGHGDPDGDFAPHDEPYARVRAWDTSRIGGSIQVDDEFDVALTVAVPDGSTGDGAFAGDTWAEGGRGAAIEWPDSPERWSKAALAGIVWSAVLDRPPGVPGPRWRR